MTGTRKTCASVLMAALIVGAAVTGAVTLRETEYSPVGQSNAIACGGACIVAGGTIAFAAGGLAYKEFVHKPQLQDIQEAEAKDTKINIYEQAVAQGQNTENINASFSNYLSDTKSIATMEGKNAYIRALNNGTSEAIARSKAKEAVAEYYAVKQHQLIAQWKTSIEVAKTLDENAESTTGVAADFVTMDQPGWYVHTDQGKYKFKSSAEVKNWKVPGSQTLTNGSTVSVPGIKYGGGSQANADQPHGIATIRGLWATNSDFSLSDTSSATFNESYYFYLAGGGTYNSYPKWHGVKVGAPTDSYSPSTWMDFEKFARNWQEIEAQNDEAQQRIDDFVNATYGGYQQGEISNEDLVDPYLTARDYSPEGEAYGAFTLSSMQSMGHDMPANVGGMKHMNISTPNGLYQGVLLSDGLPAGDEFQVGQRYNATNLDGQQFVATKDRMVELTDWFEIQSIYGTDGERLNQSSVSYRNVSYQTSNVEDFQKLMQDLRESQAQINARQQNLTESGGGGGLFSGLSSLPFGGLGVAAVVVAIVALLLLRPQ
jgi:hypothetical protein